MVVKHNTGAAAAPLSRDLADRLQRLPFGARVRLLRTERLGLDQEGFLAHLKTLGYSASAGWLSGIENNKIDPTPPRRQQLADGFALVGADRDLLVSEVSVGDHAERSYAAWQAVRLATCTEIISAAFKYTDPLDRARARAAREEIKEALLQDPAIRAASGDQVGDLSRFKDLPVTTRWMLVVEAAFMDPFAPCEPFKWSRMYFTDGVPKRTKIQLAPILSKLAEELALEDSDEAVKTIVRQRLSSDLPDRLPDLQAQTGLEMAFIRLGDDTGASRLVRGADPVGWLGWWTAAGAYLARTEVSADSPSGDEDGARLPWGSLAAGGMTVAAAIMLGGMGAATATAVGAAAARAASTKRTRSDSAARGGDDQPHQAAEFIQLLGPDRLRADLARLIATYRADAAISFSVVESSSDEPLPQLTVVVDRLKRLKDAVLALQEDRRQVDRPGSWADSALSAQADDLAASAKTLSSLS